MKNRQSVIGGNETVQKYDTGVMKSVSFLKEYFNNFYEVTHMPIKAFHIFG